MRRALLLVASLVAAVLVATTGATADTTYTDPAGDGRGVGPDVTAVAVTNDAQGVITMRITAAAVAASGLVVMFDTDLNGRFDDSTTRSIDLMTPAAGVVVPAAYARDGATNTFVPTTVPSLRATATSTELTLAFAKSELGIDKGFSFWMWGWNSASDDGDEAPDVGNWTYIVTTPPPPPPPVVAKPVIGKPIATAAIAGKKMTVTFPVMRSDTGGPMTAGTMTCDPSVSGRMLAHTESFSAGKARLTYVVPKTAKGKVLKVKLTISSDGRAATKVATFKVR
jgi:hypothetical protein